MLHTADLHILQLEKETVQIVSNARNKGSQVSIVLDLLAVLQLDQVWETFVVLLQPQGGDCVGHGEVELIPSSCVVSCRLLTSTNKVTMEELEKTFIEDVMALLCLLLDVSEFQETARVDLGVVDLVDDVTDGGKASGLEEPSLQKSIGKVSSNCRHKILQSFPHLSCSSSQSSLLCCEIISVRNCWIPPCGAAHECFKILISFVITPERVYPRL